MVHLEFPASCRCVFVLVDVLDLIRGRRLAEIGRSTEEVHTGSSSGRANVADMEAKNKRPKWFTFTPPAKSAMIFCMQGGQSLSSAPTRTAKLTGFVGHEISHHPHRFCKSNGEVGGNLCHLLKRFCFNAGLDALSEETGEFGRGGILPLPVQFDPTFLHIDVGQTPATARDFRADFNEIRNPGPAIRTTTSAEVVACHA